MFTSDPIATPRWWPIFSSAGWCCSTRSRAVASGPITCRASSSAAVPGAVRLDVPAARARALARLAVLDDHHVPELGPGAEELAVEDDAAADAGPERQRHEVGRAATRAELELGEGRAARVVLDLDRQVEPPLHLLGEVDVAERDVDGAEREPGRVVDPRRDPEADRVDAVERQRPHDVGELVEQRLLRGRHRRALDRLEDGALRDRGSPPGSWSRRGRRRSHAIRSCPRG